MTHISNCIDFKRTFAKEVFYSAVFLKKIHSFVLFTFCCSFTEIARCSKLKKSTLTEILRTTWNRILNQLLSFVYLFPP